jgi:oxygen-independent coproporphyrinogen-3 oxidase
MTDAFALAEGAEISIEVDPRVTTSDQIGVLADCGFNRISLGVQDTNPKTQAAIHRIQPFHETRALTELARARGIDHVNYDLIYGLPHQTEASFDQTLDDVLSAQPDRIALYGYAHVTWVAKQQRGFERIDLPDPEHRMRIQILAIRKLIEAGYRFIGMDHFAKPDDELCEALDAGSLRRNFMGYTTLDGVDVVAFGPSGISELANSFVQSEKGLDDWFEAIEAGGLATARGHRLSPDDEARRWIIRQVMCQGRVRAADVEARFGGGFRADYALSLERLEMLRDDKLVDLSPSGDVHVTPMGRIFLRNVAMAFDAYLDEDQEGKARVFSQTV